MLKKITVAYGDGIGPEIMSSVLKILEKAGANIDIDVIDIGERAYLNGYTSGISPESWEIIKKNKILLKAPITTPQGGGYKSLNVTIRKTLNLYANVRPCISYYPIIQTNHPNMNLVIIRENEEDLYAGIEHQQTNEVMQCLKLITKPGSEKIIRFAFEYAKTYNRKKVTCFSKDNIMKITDGIFHKIFDEVSKEYPEIESNHYIIDIGSAILASNPERFDVIVTSNLYGDIISDIGAQITGSVGIGSSANIGNNFAMFEAVHGSAPDIAGKNIANPSGLLLAAVQMLVYIKQNDIAEKIHNAWLKTLEDGILTADIFNPSIHKIKATTSEFTDAIITNLGNKPSILKEVKYFSDKTKDIYIDLKFSEKKKKELVGVDIFLDWDEDNRNPNTLGKKLENIKTENLNFQKISNRGIKVYPNGNPETFCTDHWRCRFNTNNYEKSIFYNEVIELLKKINSIGLDIIKTENLYKFDGKIAFTVLQGD
ncbi:MAG: isocitrate dehydrogenase [Candidatus Sericytochromatia bacterium]|nr:MAG: isocitrate dehydrogenase [Candidatus Sericytochromatia bacterium]